MADGSLDLASLTPADVRAIETGDDLDSLIIELEVAGGKAMEASNGSPDLHLSELLAVAHTSAGDYELAAPHAQAALTTEGAADWPAEKRAEMFFIIGL